MATREEVETWLLSHGYKKDPRSLECAGIFQYGETEWYCNTWTTRATFFSRDQDILSEYVDYNDMIISGGFIVWTRVLGPGFPGIS